jgi:6,7-dimethyl-8-ribityllumazine synthase
VKEVRLAIVVSRFNFDIIYMMLQRVLSNTEHLGAEVKVIVEVPLTFEVPAAVAKPLRREGVDAVVTLGAVIQGETEHDEVVAHQAARKLLGLSVKFGKLV